MPKSAIEERLAKAFECLNPELKRMILPAFEADFAALRGARSADRLRLVKPSPAATASSSVLTNIVDQLQQLAAIAPHEFQELRQEIERRFVIVQRAQAAHIDWSSERPWPWPLFYAVRKAPGASAAARILVTVLGLAPSEIRPLVKLAGCIQSADARAARIILNLLLGEYVTPSEATRFEQED
jgi:hypothetical protein